jgi:hypothetical protein
VVLVVAVAVRVEARKPQQHPVAVGVAPVAVVAVVAAAVAAVAAVEVCLSYHVSLKIARRGGGGIPWSVSV